jgi:hypothetical protein
MSKLPSERIREIQTEMCYRDPSSFAIQAILAYLDEVSLAEQIAKCPYDHEKSKLPYEKMICDCGFTKLKE